MKNFFSDSDFVEMMENHASDILDLLVMKGMYFSILVNLSEVSFNPQLPKHIIKNFKPITMFIIAGYTHETFEIFEEHIEFEAGFGSENIGSIVTVPLHAIIQILIDETPIFINISRKIDMEKQKSKIDRSMNIFLSNPENKKFVKNKKFDIPDILK